MAMKRRDFFGTILAGLVGATIAPSAAPAHPGIVTNGWAGELLKLGDVITLEGYFRFDPVTHKATHELQRFKVGPITADGDISLEVVPHTIEA
jgi:hypothetical protein